METFAKAVPTELKANTNTKKTKLVSFNLPEDLFYDIKLYALKNKMPIKQIVHDLIKEFYVLHPEYKGAASKPITQE